MTKAKKPPEKDDWMQKKWRPMMAIMYMTVCIFDFIIFPIMFTIVQFWETQAANDAFRQWQPLTLVGAGLFHMAMGAVLGITAWSRGQEKIAGVSTSSNFGMNTTSPMTPPSYSQPQTGVNYQQAYSASTYEQTYDTISVSPVASGYKGKKAPMQPPDPII